MVVAIDAVDTQPPGWFGAAGSSTIHALNTVGSAIARLLGTSTAWFVPPVNPVGRRADHREARGSVLPLARAARAADCRVSRRFS